MQGKGRYGKYLHAAETLVGFLMVNLAFLIASLSDEFVVGFRWKVTWLIVNISYLPVAYLRANLNQTRATHLDIIVKHAFEAAFIHALFFFSILAFLDSWVHNMSFYLWFYALLFTLLPVGWISTRLCTKHLRKKGINYTRAIIIGNGDTAIRLQEEMLSDPGYGYRVLGIFASSQGIIPDSCYLGTLDNLERFVIDNNVDEIYYAISGEDAETFRRVVKIADDSVVQFYYVPQVSPYVTRVGELSNIGRVPILSIRKNPLKKPLNRALKRGFDLLFSTTFLIVSPVVFIPIVIAVKLSSPGPIFFKQKRTGYLGREFYCYKFRTMKVNASSDSKQATRNDSRITKVGKFLRHTSMDELPQFINVWLGDMSVVGPRPHMIKQTTDYTKLIDKYMVRHMIKPGITGWAQITGYRGQTDELWQMEKRVECDVWYIEHWNFFLDLKIIVLTVINAIRGEENAF